MKNFSLLLITAILLIACGEKHESLAGRQFQLVEAGADKTPEMVHISFVNEHRMDIWMLRGSTGNSVAVSPYKFDDGLLTFRGADYEVKQIDNGFDLYVGDQLAYKLIATATRVKVPSTEKPRIRVKDTKKQQI